MNNIAISTPNIQQENYHPAIREELDRIPKYIEQIKSANRYMRIAEDLEARFPELYLHTQTNLISGLVYVAFRFLEISHAGLVLRHLKIRYDLSQTTSMWACESDSSLNWTLAQLRIVGHFNSPNAQCAFVQNGTKTVPVFEMQCKGKPVLNIGMDLTSSLVEVIA